MRCLLRVTNTDMTDLSTEAQAKFYDTFWAHRPSEINVHETHRLAKIFSAMVTVKENVGHDKLRICDLGCGIGWLANELRVFGEVKGIDFSEEAIRLAKNRWPEIDFEIADITKYQTNERFDVVISSEVIEHITNKHNFMNTVVTLLNKEGYMIITCPNAKVKHHIKEQYLKIQPIEKWLTPTALRLLVERYMVVQLQETFLFNFSNDGMLRVINSYKLNRFVRALGCSGVFDALCASSGYGLYQILVARKKRQL